MIERTLVLVKPDGVCRGLTGEIIRRFENAGLKIIGLKLMHVDYAFAQSHYREDIADRWGNDVREKLLQFLIAAPVVAMALEGVDCIANVRKLVGATESASALPGTIRGDFTHVSFAHATEQGIVIRNVVHASADATDAAYEIPLWFTEQELCLYKRSDEEHVV